MFSITALTQWTAVYNRNVSMDSQASSDGMQRNAMQDNVTRHWLRRKNFECMIQLL